MESSDLERTKRKFEVAYFVAKNELPMTKYKEILDLEKLHGVDIGGAYNTDRYCGEIIDYIGESTCMKHQLNKDIAKAKFFSVLCDGSTDSAVIENEVVYALHFDPEPTGSNSVEVKVSFLQINYLKNQTAEGVSSAIEESFRGVAESIEESFNSLGIVSIDKKLIGFTSDGASVNRGDRSSVKTILREKSPWLVFIWCIAHCLELALDDALSDTSFR